VTEHATLNAFTGVSRLKLFWALSRTAHGLLDMCTPAFAALLALGALPPVDVVLIGLVTTFAGYTAVYALNDLVDYRVDREKVAAGGLPAAGSDLDGVIVRHPLAQGLLSFREGLAWAAAWAGVALIGALLLNPVCAAIFVGAAALETIYCLLWRVSPYRTLVSGAVKTSGAVAAVFAVDPDPSAAFLAALFTMLFFWEIGGQNIPNDLADIEEDRRMRARTLPVCLGAGRAVALAVASLAAAVLVNPAVFLLSPLPAAAFLGLPALGAGGYLLLWPAWRLHRGSSRSRAMALFNRASIYPPALLAVVLISLIFP
jgi:4-hydroxybenzoate polyprenyltransferase